MGYWTGVAYVVDGTALEVGTTLSLWEPHAVKLRKILKTVMEVGYTINLRRYLLIFL